MNASLCCAPRVLNFSGVNGTTFGGLTRSACITPVTQESVLSTIYNGTTTFNSAQAVLTAVCPASFFTNNTFSTSMAFFIKHDVINMLAFIALLYTIIN